MLKKLLLFVLLSIPAKINHIKDNINICTRNPIYCKIIKNNQKIDRKYALKLSNVIYHIAVLYDINPNEYSAILAQESMYKLEAVNKITGDYGIAQINHNTARSYGFNTKRLTTDLIYSVEAGAIVLSDIKKKYGNKELDWWTRYNGSNFSKRKQYKTLVARYM